MRCEQMNFPERLKQLRTNKELTQRELAKQLSLSNGSIAMYETGKREPDFNTLEKIADYFNVSTDYLLGRKPPGKPKKADVFEQISELPEDKKKMIETMLKVFKAEQESDDDNTKNNVDFLK
jgi:transcriptional regulator with XRE-family HTH domain